MVSNSGFIEIQNKRPILGDHRIYFGTELSILHCSTRGSDAVPFLGSSATSGKKHTYILAGLINVSIVGAQKPKGKTSMRTQSLACE